MRRSPTGRRCGSPVACSCWRLLWCRGGTRQTQNEESGGKPGKSGIVQHQPHAGSRDRHGHEHDRRPQQVEGGCNHRNPAESQIVVGRDGEVEGRAQPSALPALAGERHRGMLDGEIADIERLADRQEADDQEPVGLAGARKKCLHLTTVPARSPRSAARGPGAPVPRVLLAVTAPPPESPHKATFSPPPNNYNMTPPSTSE